VVTNAHSAPFSRFALLLTCNLQPDASPESLQIATVLIHRERPAIDGRHLGSLKKLAMNNIKRFSHHRGKDEIRLHW
jgi:hypothetical protein